MGDNEDYLDSLLRQASVIDNPDSALSRVKDITLREREENEKDSLDTEGKEDSLSFDGVLGEEQTIDSNTASLVADAENVSSEEFEGLDLDLSEAKNDDIVADNLLENFSNEELLLNSFENEENIIPTEADLNDLLNESVTSLPSDNNDVSHDEIDNIIDALADNFEVNEDISDAGLSSDLPDASELNNELQPEVDSDFTNPDASEDYIINNENPSAAETDSLDIVENDDLDDIEKLLNSGFSGEIDVPDGTIDNIFDNNPDTEQVETSEPDSHTEELSINEEEADNNAVMSPEDIDKLINQINTEEDIPEIDGLDGNDFSEADIDNLISKANDAEPNEIKEELEIDLADLEAFENEFGIHDKNEIMEGNSEEELLEESMDISDIMGDSDGSDDADIMSLLNDAVSKSEAKEELEADNELNEDNKTKNKKKKHKEKKAKNNKSSEDKPQKEKGKIAKFFEFLTKEDEEEENLIEAKDAGSAEGLENGENKEILDELDSEVEEKGKKKKKKKDKGNKKKDAAKESEDDLDEDSEEEGGKDKKKAKKPKKEKKERKPLQLDIDTGKPLSKKNVILIFILCLSILGAIILVVNIIPPMIQSREAREAFYRGDYETTYQTFFGEELDEKDQILFESSEILLKLQHKYDAYKAYMNMNMKVEALDQLLQAVSKYETWHILAESHNVSKQFDEIYEKIKNNLNLEFSLSEDEAKAIIALPTDTEYSLKCYSIVTGTEYIDPNAPMPSEFILPVQEEEIVLEDQLQEEGN